MQHLTRLVAAAFATLLAPALVLAQSVCVTNGDCTAGQVCVAGLCQPCLTDAQCNDGNACNGAEICQSGSCDPVAGCRNLAVANGTSCSDGNVCNGAETCQAGACTPGSALNCADANPCTTDTCDPVAGCQHTALANGTPCPDGDLCNGVETCQAGVCTGGTPLGCNDNNACTTDSCDPATGCRNVPVVNGTPCGDVPGRHLHRRHRPQLQRQQPVHRRHVRPGRRLPEHGAGERYPVQRRQRVRRERDVPGGRLYRRDAAQLQRQQSLHHGYLRR